ncbi:pyridoxamine 5'-phosphate oxidase family protein [Chitinibacter sp. FCG-7]|uniref:Pyridoxamine 5'-phosphate oxidase family protein n=1 Tax=Chitinibacter mangrovi TaxID=3153927 RepID=A0AAU7F6R7_9NEIS
MLWPEVMALIRRSRMLALATHSAHMPGYPHVSWLPTVADEAGRPLVMISRLAEHTQNILQDHKVSVLLHDDDMALEKARLTILGDLQPVAPDELLAARLARYNPQLAACLDMSDFSVWRLWPRRARLIAGFGRMGWVEGDEWESAAALTLAQEAELIAASVIGAGELLGVDLAGCDIRLGEQIRRFEFATICHDATGVAQALKHIARDITA